MSFLQGVLLESLLLGSNGVEDVPCQGQRCERYSTRVIICYGNVEVKDR